MAVGIECDLDAGVTEHFADHLGVNTSHKQDRRGGMPQVVKANDGQP